MFYERIVARSWRDAVAAVVWYLPDRSTLIPLCYRIPGPVILGFCWVIVNRWLVSHPPSLPMQATRRSYRKSGRLITSNTWTLERGYGRLLVKHKEQAMERPPRLLTIGRLMIGIALLAALFALPNGLGLVAIALFFPFLAIIGAQWLVFQRHRRLAACGFGAVATLANVLYVACCVAPDAYLLGPLFLGWAVLVGPAVGSLGAAWARLVTRDDTMPRRPAPAAWLSVITLSMMPLMTLWTLWPLHLAFFAARPALERLADQVAAGEMLNFPRRVGLFRVAGAALEPISGNIGLMIDANPNGPTGFVRVSRGASQNRQGPFRWDDLLVDLGHDWEYREED